MKPMDIATADRIRRSEFLEAPERPENWPVTQVEPTPHSKEALTETPDNKQLGQLSEPRSTRTMLTASHPDVLAIRSLLHRLETAQDAPPDLMAMPGIAVLFEHCQAVAVIDGLKRGLVRE